MPSRPPQLPRFAIQKARGKGWKTLEVGEDLAHAEARFELMLGVNPRAYFRLIRLEYSPDSAYGGMEFNWTLVRLHDPNKSGAEVGKAKPGRQHKEKVPLPWRFYGAVVLIGLLIGAFAYLHWGLSRP